MNWDKFCSRVAQVTWITIWLFILQLHCKTSDLTGCKSELKRSDSMWFVLFTLSWEKQSQMNKKKNCSLDLGHICLQSERTHSQTKDEFQMVFMFPWRALQEGDTIWRVIPDKKKIMLFFIARISLPPHETLLPSSHQSPHFKWAGHREINFTFTH